MDRQRRRLVVGLLALPLARWGFGGLAAAAGDAKPSGAGPAKGEVKMVRLYSVKTGGFYTAEKIVKTEAEWRAQLTAEQYHVTREKGTERAFTGETWNNHEKGIYQCVCCGTDLYSSEHKFESGTGWPSFWQPVAEENIATAEDRSWFSVRTEVLCRRCDAHLGHVFTDGPKPTGLRHCMNSAALRFVKGEAGGQR